MKIAFVGTHGVGKTALCYGLAAHLKRIDISVGLVQEVARDCPMPINRETTLQAQAWILHTQIAREIAAGERNRAVICDRSVLDNYAYLVHRVGRRREYDPLIGEWLKGYSLLVKVPIWQPPRFDGVRALDLSFQREIDDEVERLLDAWRPPVFRLRACDLEDWVPRVVTALGLPLVPPQADLFESNPAVTPDVVPEDPTGQEA